MGLIILSFSILISIFYVLPIKNKSLRDIPYLKIHLISLIWIIAIGGFQLVNENNFELNNWLFVGAHYFYILAVTIPFDIRDLEYDHPKQKTIPQIIGIQKSKMVSISLIWVYYFLIRSIKSTIIGNYYFLFSLIITSILIFCINKNRSNFYYSGLIEFSIFIVGVSLMLG